MFFGQKIQLVAECTNLEGKEVTFKVFEKEPLLVAKDKPLPLVQDGKEVTETGIKTTVKDGYAVVEVELRKKNLKDTQNLIWKMKERNLSADKLLDKRESFKYKTTDLLIHLDCKGDEIHFNKKVKKSLLTLNTIKWYDPLNNPMLCLYTQKGNYRPRYNVFGKVRKERSKIYHQGIDLLALPNSNVYACGDGKVVRANNSGKGYGNIVAIKLDNPKQLKLIKRTDFSLNYSSEGETMKSSNFDEDGYIYLKYCHLKKIEVKNGDRVKAGQVIGKNGTSGYGKTKDPHLHFEIASNAYGSGLNYRCHPGQYINYKGVDDMNQEEKDYQAKVAEKDWD